MAFLGNLGGVVRQSVARSMLQQCGGSIAVPGMGSIQKGMASSIVAVDLCGLVDSVQRCGITTSTWPTTAHTLGFGQGLWRLKECFVSQSASRWGAGIQQVRQVVVEVTNDDLERAIRKMKRKLKDDNGISLLRERQYYRKPSELKVLARKERDKRIAKKAFREKLKWIQNRRSRGF